MLEFVVLGDTNVGKSSLIDRFCNDKFTLTYTPTTRKVNYLRINNLVEMSYICKTITLSGKKLKLKIWDTPGQTDADSVLSHCCKGMNGFILMYSTQDPDSLRNLKFWIENLEKKLSSKLKAVVVGNKIPGQEVQINYKDVEQFVLEHNLRHFEVNVQDDLEIDMPFLELVAAIRYADLNNVDDVRIGTGSNLYIDILN